jgi:NADH:ubiquinone oxidoreductase subunit 4 (subunit M)
MLLTLLLVMFTYLFAGERFTRFLYPEPGVMSGYLEAAALPGGLFDGMVAAAVLFISMAWIAIFAKSHGRTIHLPEWMIGIQTRLYLIFMNRLYLDGLALRLSRSFRRAAERLDRSRLFLPVAALIAIGCVLPIVIQAREWSLEKMARVFLIALMLPLFPLHGVYVVALTRLPRHLAIVLSILVPTAGLYGLTGLLPDLSPEILGSIGVFALFGALHGSIKALVQVRVANLIAYAGLAFYSILWWHTARTGTVTPQAAVYTGAAAVVTGGLLFAWERVRVRHGDLDLNRIGGLARPMPRLAILMALLVMAAAGLPPFGLFSGYLAMLLGPSMTSLELSIILLTWFTASWYLFKLMQRLLFGPHRSDLSYQDLRPAEVAPLVLMVLVLVALGVVPYEVLEAGARTAMELRWKQ